MPAAFDVINILIVLGRPLDQRQHLLLGADLKPGQGTELHDGVSFIQKVRQQFVVDLLLAAHNAP